MACLASDEYTAEIIIELFQSSMTLVARILYGICQFHNI